MTDCNVMGNFAIGSGGIINGFSLCDITNSSIENNSASGNGGGIHNRGNCTLTG